MTAAKNIGLDWNFASVWNKTLDNIEEKPLVPRDYIYASELGGAYCDRYLKMYGVKFSNPPNIRSKRKFQAGHLWEWIVGMVLRSSGMLKSKQVKVDTKLPRLLPVHGRLDYIVGGNIDWNAAKKNIDDVKEKLNFLEFDLPPFFFSAIDNFIKECMGKPLREVVQEMKSVSSFMMEKVQKTGAMIHHKLQLFHYINGNELGINEGKLTYICKDDCIMEEFIIRGGEELYQAYRDDIKRMTYYYNAGFNTKKPTELMPPRQPVIIFEEGMYRFNKNFWVEYSPYLTMLYGYETPESYRMTWQSKLSSWNRVFRRCVNGDKITPKNNDVIVEAKKMFPWDKLVAAAKKARAFIKDYEDDEDSN